MNRFIQYYCAHRANTWVLLIAAILAVAAGLLINEWYPWLVEPTE